MKKILAGLLLSGFISAAHGQALTGTSLNVGPGAIGGNAITNFLANAPNTGYFNVGWTNSYFRQGYNLATLASQEGDYVGCNVPNSPSVLVEYDCGWHQATTLANHLANAVGFRSEGDIPGTNNDGTAWGGIDYAQISPGGDGQLIGREIDVTNNGTQVLDPNGGGKVKLGVQLAANGSAPATTGINLIGTWAEVLHSVPTAGGNFIFYGSGTTNPLFGVGVDGRTFSVGFAARTGIGGAYDGHVFNIHWSGSGAHLYIDNTDLGVITLH